jgi:hypothetical protein
MTPEEITIISVVVNVALGLIAIYFAKHMNKIRQIKDLAVAVIDALDDHEISEEEVENIIDEFNKMVGNDE